jgi:hypothetical protein
VKKSTVVRIAIIVAWLAVLGWFLHHEALLYDSFQGYHGLFDQGVLVRDSWMTIIFKDVPVGYTHTRVDVNEASLSSRYVVYNEMRLNINVSGLQHMVKTSMNAALDPLYHLQRFSLSIDAGMSKTEISGKRVKGETFEVITRTGGRAQRSTVVIPDDALVYSPMPELAVSRLRPGEKITMKVFNPLLQSTDHAVIEGREREPITFQGEEKEVNVVVTTFHRMELKSWIDDDGTVLRQELPLKDFVAEAASPKDAMNAAFDAGYVDDILRSLAGRHTGAVITDSTTTTRMKIRMTGVDPAAAQLESERQVIESADAEGIVMTVSSASLPEQGIPMGSSPEELQPFLESTTFIPADHPEIVAKARSITKHSADSREAAVAIHEWTNKKIAKSMSPGIPSALDVLRRREGDCNEHTYLFVALARASGMPAKVKVGVVYHRGAFYYHAWPSVYVGKWVEMDPTFGQAGVDATHIALFEGELEDQLGLVNVIGRLEVEVLEVE